MSQISLSQDAEILIDILENGDYFIIENVFGRTYEYILQPSEVKIYFENFQN